ncbi:CCA tRNA nucleotidyltransferase [Siccirubricoccus sp. KC 17139]|uniref:CCA tRNA nucleotidyltransferase n=1 Tax=Siccirubricoccus soli TaxID=2899147 RepID=A0ABT1DDV8_9PROT|nr:CCA tRNA nucleotidyltransferase [Siccirubricoccus soli]MCO6419807.1 CCA tRNA nucleotidyltransferase [Siccirubricoccus soli]MCP2685942.1 CCA tRNA nucleotidyltransferase [Siccirubricoccus soli]
MSQDPPRRRIPPPGFLAAGAPAAVLAALPGARAVGGAVRDTLAGRPIQDVDVAVPLPPEAAAARLRAAGLKVFETGLAHGTLTAVLDGQPVEVTSLRRDVLTDGRHAEVAWSTDWREDAARRDFTINAMSLSAAGELWDYFGGAEDLAAGKVRFVGDPATRLAEDYLRALRFFRFQARYGHGAPDAAAVAAIRAAVPGLARLSAERVWMELKRLLAAPAPGAALALMAETGVLTSPHVLGEGIDLARLGRLLALGAPLRLMLRLAALAPTGKAGWAAALATRLKFSAEERLALLRRAGDLPPPPPALEGKALRRWLFRAAGEGRPDPTLAEDLAWLAEATDGVERGALRARLAATPVPVFPLQGRDALALGMPPGAAMGRALQAVRAWWLEGGCTADHAACLEELRRHAGPA